MIKKFLLLLAVTATGARPLDRLMLFIWSVYVYVADACSLPPVPIRPTLRVLDRPSPVTLRTLSDLWVLKDVLVDREYEVADLPQVSIILDIGSNIGLSTLYLAARFPNARVYSIEPNPAIALQLHENVASIPNVSIHALALAEADGPVAFACDGRAISGALARPGVESVIVEGIRPQHLPARLGIVADIGLIKFDIEGAERYLLKDLPVLRPTVLLGEMHYDHIGLSKGEVKQTLTSYGVRERFIRGEDRSIICAILTA